MPNGIPENFSLELLKVQSCVEMEKRNANICKKEKLLYVFTKIKKLDRYTRSEKKLDEAKIDSQSRFQFLETFSRVGIRRPRDALDDTFEEGTEFPVKCRLRLVQVQRVSRASRKQQLMQLQNLCKQSNLRYRRISQFLEGLFRKYNFL